MVNDRGSAQSSHYSHEEVRQRAKQDSDKDWHRIVSYRQLRNLCGKVSNLAENIKKNEAFLIPSISIFTERWTYQLFVLTALVLFNIPWQVQLYVYMPLLTLSLGVCYKGGICHIFTERGILVKLFSGLFLFRCSYTRDRLPVPDIVSSFNNRPYNPSCPPPPFGYLNTNFIDTIFLDTSLVKINDRWYVFDDEKVSTASTWHVKSELKVLRKLDL